MKPFEITYFHPKHKWLKVIIVAETKEAANRQFMATIIDGHEIGYCKTEEYGGL